jgi:hypothetical protein
MSKKITLLSTLCFLLFTLGVNGQTPPNAFNYSAVVRNAAGLPIATTTIGIQISILKTSPTGASQYSENHFVNTDAFGLFNLVIGAGAVQIGAMATIDWSNDNYYLKVGMDATGGTNFLTMGTTQLLSVPYAMYAKSAGSVTNGSSQSFSTPTVTTQSATSIINSSATVFGTVNPNGLFTDAIGFEYGPTTSYGFIQGSNTNYLSGNNQSQVQANLANLNSNTTYHYRLIAKNAVDYSLGNDMTFTTTYGAPILGASIVVDSINSNNFRFYTNINPNGSLTTITFQYGPTMSLGNTVNCVSNINGGVITQVFSNVITLPYSGGNYNYVRCIATNSFGTVTSPIYGYGW